MSKVSGSNKRTMGSIRAKANMPAKAGKRRPPNMISKRDRNGTRQWETVNSTQVVKRNNFGIHEMRKHEFDIYDGTNQRVQDRKMNLYNIRNPKNKDRIFKIKNTLYRLANTKFSADPFWFATRWKDFKMGWISMDEIEKGKVA